MCNVFGIYTKNKKKDLPMIAFYKFEIFNMACFILIRRCKSGKIKERLHKAKSGNSSVDCWN